MIISKKYKKIPYCCVMSLALFLVLPVNVFAIVLFPFNGLGVIWSKDHDYKPKISDASIAIATHEDKVYVLGRSGTEIILQARYSDDGSLIGSIIIDSEPDLFRNIYSDIAVDPSGVYIVGVRNGFDAGNHIEGQFGIIQKRSLNDGSLIWEKEKKFGTNTQTNGVDMDASGIYTISGSVDWSNGAFWNYKTTTEKLSKNDGNIIWENNNGQGGSPGYISVSQERVYVTSGGLPGSESSWTLRNLMSNNGTVLWGIGAGQFLASSNSNNSDELYTSISLTLPGKNSHVLTKHSPNGSSTLWSDDLGGFNIRGMTADSEGVYLLGTYSSFQPDEMEIFKYSPSGIGTETCRARGELGNGRTDITSDGNGSIYVVGVSKIEKRTNLCEDFSFTSSPLRHAVNPGWSEDYLLEASRVGGFNGDIRFNVRNSPMNVINNTWPFGEIIEGGSNGPITMRVQAEYPVTEKFRGTNFDLSIHADGKLQAGFAQKDEYGNVDFYINKRPIVGINIMDSNTMNQGDYFRIRDNDLVGSHDPDKFAPGNTLQIFVADFDGDGAVDKCFSLLAIPGCSSNPSDDPRTNIWQFQYNNPGNYTFTYAVLDDLFDDGPAPFSWTEALKSAGFGTLGIEVKSVGPGNAPVAAIEIQDAGGLSIDNAMTGQSIYAYAGNSTDIDGNIDLVSFCVDTTPETGNAPKNCDGSITPWVIPPFGWNVSDSIRGWSSVNKKWETQMDASGTYAVYVAVQDNDGILSDIVMDTITIDAIAGSTLKVCVEKCDSGGDSLLGDTLVMNKNSTVKLRACYNSAPQCNDANGDVTAPPTTWDDTDSPKNSVSLNFNGFDEEVKSGGNTGDEDVQVLYNGNPAQTFRVNVQGSSVCGDGVKEGLEKCDDGVANNGSCPKMCSAICAKNNCSDIGNWKEVPPQ